MSDDAHDKIMKSIHALRDKANSTSMQDNIPPMSDLGKMSFDMLQSMNQVAYHALQLRDLDQARVLHPIKRISDGGKNEPSQ
jgi:hypothetical protein